MMCSFFNNLFTITGNNFTIDDKDSESNNVN